MVIKSNMKAMNANRQLNIVTDSQQKSMEKLSSGYQVNRAADDAAGLAISEKMRRQIRGLNQASTNAQDGVSFCQIADGALNEVHDMLKRSKELAIKASNATNSDEDRAMIQEEIAHLSSEIDRVHQTSVFNEMNVFSDEGLIAPASVEEAPAGRMTFNIGDMPIEVEWNFVDSTGSKVSDPDEVQATGSTPSIGDGKMADFVVKAAAMAVDKLKSTYTGLFGAAGSDGIKIGLNFANIDGKGNTLASAALSMRANSDSAVMSYTLNVDTSDYSVSGFAGMTDDKKADLAATIAHEMTHLVMYDTLTDNMLSGASAFPKWFVEGMAQTSSGDNGWVSYQIGPTSSDSDIKSYMSKLSTMPYGSGYLATMALGYAAGGNDVTKIAQGLDKIMTDVANKTKTFDQAIKDYTGFSGLTDFQNSFKTGGKGTLDAVKAILGARGASGAGSLLAGSLADSEGSIFSPAKVNAAPTSADYEVKKDSTRYSNAYGTGYTFPPAGGAPGGGGSEGGSLYLQVGTEAGQGLYVDRFNASADALFGGSAMDVSTIASAQDTIDMVDDADARVSYIRSYYGATQNRLEHTIQNLDNVAENTTDAESRIRDTDMAKEMVRLSMLNVLQQAGNSMLAQANQSNQGVLSLLG